MAEETGLPVNSSEAAQKEAAEKAEAKEADEEEEAGGWSQMSQLEWGHAVRARLDPKRSRVAMCHSEAERVDVL